LRHVGEHLVVFGVGRLGGIQVKSSARAKVPTDLNLF
jgi:hypothetical protein